MASLDPQAVNGPGRPWIAGVAFRAAAVVLALLVVSAAVEITVRVRPDILGQQVSNRMFSKYKQGPGGMYFLDATTSVTFMWPDFETRAYYNGYFWNHRTDRYGFRNPRDRTSRKVLLLGDSLVYGHGVEEDETAAHLLASRYGDGVYNMGRQGDCLYQEYVLFRAYLGAFRPGTVMVFVFSNDFDDVLAYRTGAQLRDLPEISGFDYARILREVEAVGKAGPPRQAGGSWRSRLVAPRAFMRLARRVFGAGHKPGATTRTPIAAGGKAPGAQGLALASVYYRQVLADMARRSRAAGVDLVAVNLDIGYVDAGQDPRDWERARQRTGSLLAGAARKNGFGYVDASRLFEGCPSCRLTGDGHLSPEGHARLAAFVHRALAGRAAGRRQVPSS
jgi:hypothetical protein